MIGLGDRNFEGKNIVNGLALSIRQKPIAKLQVDNNGCHLLAWKFAFSLKTAILQQKSSICALIIEAQYYYLNQFDLLCVISKSEHNLVGLEVCELEHTRSTFLWTCHMYGIRAFVWA